MNLYLSLTLVFCALNAILAEQEYTFTNEQVNCKLLEDQSKILCNLSGNVECGIRANLPEEVLNDENVDMLVVGFEEGREKTLAKSDVNEIKFTLYKSHTTNKKLTKTSTPLEFYYSDNTKKSANKGLVVSDKQCFDKMVKLFKVVTFIKKEQTIDIGDNKKVTAFGEILLRP